jgi:hypothetical protein
MSLVVKRIAVILLAIVVVSFAVVLIGEALDFGGLAWLGALVVALLLVSLVDREYFYGPPSRSRPH